MKSQIASSGIRVAVIFATLLGWVVLSNHCALASLGARPPAEHRCCQQIPNDGGSPDEGAKPQQCCNALRILLPEAAKTPVMLAHVIAVRPAVWELENRAARNEACVVKQDTGPPERAASFAELVLHRSVQPHAPPAA